MIADELADYLFARSTGHIGSLMTLIARGCYRAVRSGDERLHVSLFDKVKNDEAAERPSRPGRRPGRRSARGQPAADASCLNVVPRARALPIRVAPVPGEALDSWLTR